MSVPLQHGQALVACNRGDFRLVEALLKES
jgi:hypothetical protein